MSIDKNKDLGFRIIYDFINKNDPVAADDMFADDFVNHSPSLGVSPDREGLKQMIGLLHTAFPDYHMDVEDLIAEGDKVALRMRARD
jgi:predicted ester cyclase